MLPAMAFGGFVRMHRRGLLMSQEDLAAGAGLHRTEISLIERGRRDVRLETICRLAHGLSMTPAQLLADLDLERITLPDRPPKIYPTRKKRKPRGA